jgi:hypothetical protein
MPFRPGVSGNPRGRLGGQWLARKRRIAEAQKSFDILVQCRDALTKREDLSPGELKDLSAICERIMTRCVGMPQREGSGASEIDPARIFIDTLEAFVRYLAPRDPVALEYLELHIRGFAEQTKNGGLLPDSQPSTALAKFQGIVVDDGHE